MECEPLRNVLRILRYLWPYKWYFLLTMVGVVAMSSIEAAKPILIAFVVDEVISGRRLDLLTPYLLAILGASVVHAGVFFGTQYLRHFLGESVVYDIRNALYRHLHYLEARFHDTARTGELMSRVTSDVHAVRRFAGDGLYMTARIAFRLVTVAGAAVVLSWKLTLIVILVAPMLYITVRRFQRQVE